MSRSQGRKSWSIIRSTPGVGVLADPRPGVVRRPDDPARATLGEPGVRPDAARAVVGVAGQQRGQRIDPLLDRPGVAADERPDHRGSGDRGRIAVRRPADLVEPAELLERDLRRARWTG